MITLTVYTISHNFLYIFTHFDNFFVYQGTLIYYKKNYEITNVLVVQFLSRLRLGLIIICSSLSESPWRFHSGTGVSLRSIIFPSIVRA